MSDMFGQPPITQLVSITKNVTTPATAVQLITAKTPCSGVWISARPGNTNPVAVGGSDVLATAGSEKGILLKVAAGYDSKVFLPIDDASKIYIDAVTGGEGVSALIVK